MEGNPIANNSNERRAEHNKRIPGMFARLKSGELVKIVSADEKEQMASVQIGADGDVDHVPYTDLETLVTTTTISDEWEQGGGMKKAA